MNFDYPSLRGHGMISIDTETHDPNLFTMGPGYGRDGKIAGISIATEKGFSAYLPIGHEAGGNLPKSKVIKWLKEQMALPVPKVGANIIYDLGYLEAEGIKVAGPFFDIQVAEALLDENRFSYGLDVIGKARVGKGKDESALADYVRDKLGHKKKSDWKSHIWRCPPDVVAPYAVTDAVLPLEIFKVQKAKLEEENLWNLFIMESKLIPMLLAMRQRGIRVDLDLAERLLNDFERRKQEELAEIWKMAKSDISIWAANDLAILFDEQGVDYPLTAKTKKPSFTSQFLARCEHPIAQRIVSARKLDKLCSVFLRGAILESNWKGRVHCSFHQLRGEGGGTVSGRFSSSQPNLQQVSAHSEDGKKIREIFIPDEGQKLWSFDYSQIEYRLMVNDAYGLKLRGADHVVAQYAKDPATDFHQVIADMAGIDRKQAKTVNFGVAYGEGVAKLIKSLNLTQEEGEAFMRKYHTHAPFMKPLSQHYTNLAAKDGFIQTLLWRKRRFDTFEIVDRKTKEPKYFPHRVPGSRRAFTHAALNSRIQGSAADMMKKAMVDIWESGVCSVLGVPQLTVHDELDGSMPMTKAGREAYEEIGNLMRNVLKLHVPMLVDGGIGNNWKEAKSG